MAKPTHPDFDKVSQALDKMTGRPRVSSSGKRPMTVSEYKAYMAREAASRRATHETQYDANHNIVPKAKSGFLLKDGSRTNDYSTFLKDRNPAKYELIQRDREAFRASSRAARREGGAAIKSAMHSKIGKLATVAALVATAFGAMRSSSASASEAQSNVGGRPTGLTKSPAQLKAYAQQVVDAKYMVGQAGDEHPKVATMYGKADRARAAAMASHKNPALGRALLAQPLGGPTDTPTNEPAHAEVEAGVQAQKRAIPQQKTTKHPKGHDLKDGWWVKNAKGKTFWRRAHK